MTGNYILDESIEAHPRFADEAKSNLIALVATLKQFRFEALATQGRAIIDRSQSIIWMKTIEENDMIVFIVRIRYFACGVYFTKSDSSAWMKYGF